MNDEKYLKGINIFWIGFIIYSLSFIFLSVTLAPNYKLYNAIEILGILIFIYGVSGIIHFKIENSYLKKIYTVYFIWVLITMARGFSFNYEFLKQTLLDPFGGIFLYLSPLILLFPLKIQNISKVFKVILLFGIIFLSCTVFYYKRLFDIGSQDARNLIEYLSKILSIPSGYILLTYVYHKRKYAIISFTVILINLFFAILQARRGLIFTTATILIFFIIIMMYNNKKNFNAVLLIIFASPLILISFGTLVGTQNKLFDYLKDRKGDDTRTGVELYYYADMADIDWAIGRGMSGLVAAPFDDVGEDNISSTPGYRSGIETDYLNIILKGGIISLGLMMFIFIPAIILGFFYSKNTLSKAAALWIALWIFDLYPTTVTTFTLNYLLVWLSVGICYSFEIRRMNETKLREFFKSSMLNIQTDFV